ncbi:MAG: hypothetical protein K2W96_12965, partial [Gemmataceae bacterium]|nr:hypothetical protein [Gemmataceae bacterium]
MPKFLASLFAWLLDERNRGLAQQLAYLKAENAILRGKLPKRINILAAEKSLLMALAKPLGAAIRFLVGIVSPGTFMRWLRAARKPRSGPPAKKVCRPPTGQQIRELVLRMARENAWGYTRIAGELGKLGIEVSRSCVRDILKSAGLPTAPDRGESGWAAFIRAHAETLWACDFFSVKTWTLTGIVDMTVLFFIHVGSRKVRIAGITGKPTAEWVAERGKETAAVMKEEKATHLIRDRDGKYVAGFDEAMEAADIETRKTALACPDQNAFAERWVRSVREECLDRFVVFGEKHLAHLLDGAAGRERFDAGRRRRRSGHSRRLGFSLGLGLSLGRRRVRAQQRQRG